VARVDFKSAYDSVWKEKEEIWHTLMMTSSSWEEGTGCEGDVHSTYRTNKYTGARNK
jgi:hypothetical protein